MINITVLEVDICNEREKQKAMNVITSLSGIDSLAMDMKEKKLTVIGSVDPVDVVNKLKKKWKTKILTVEPEKKPEKKDNDDKDANKKDNDDKKGIPYIPYYPHYNPYYAQGKPWWYGA